MVLRKHGCRIRLPYINRLNMRRNTSIKNLYFFILIVGLGCLFPCKASSQEVPEAIVFRTSEAIWIRWPGHAGSDFDGYRLYRSVNGGGLEPVHDGLLQITLSWEEIQRRAGRMQGAMYLSFFGVRDGTRDISPQERASMLSAPESAAFARLMSVTQSVIGDLLAETYVDHLVPDGTSLVQYQVAVVQGGQERVHARTPVLDPAAIDSVPGVDSLQAEPRDRAAMLSWEKNRDHLGRGEVTSYNLYRSTALIGPFERVNVSSILPLDISSGEQQLPSDRQTHLDRFLENGQVYYYHVRGVNSFGIEGGPGEVVMVIPGDPEPPPAPYSLEAEVFGAAVRLQWSHPEQRPVQGFEVYRSGSRNGDFDKVFPVSDIQLRPDLRHWIDLEAKPGEASYYYLRAVGINGRLSQPSDTLSYFYVDQVAPAPPRGVVATPDTARIIIRWQPNNESDLLGYEIERASDPVLTSRFLLGKTDASGVHATLITDTFYVDTVPLQSRTTHGYLVYALDRSLNRSRPSEMATARVVDITPPSVPAIYELSYTDQEIFLRWGAVPEDDLYAYRIYRAIDDSTRFVFHSGGFEPQFTEAVTAAGTYYYRVSAVDSTGNESVPSQPVRIEITEGPPAPPVGGQAIRANGRVEVSWEASPSNHVSGYFIQRLNPETNRLVDLGETDSATTSFRDHFAPAGGNHVYLIRARDVRWRMSQALEIPLVSP